MKKVFYALWCLVLFFSVATVLAIDLTLTRVGVLSTIGVDYSTINYSGTIPTLEGTASPSATVLIKIKTSTDSTISASSTGVWQFTPGVLDPGNNDILVTSGTQSLSFVLIFNATPSATPSATPTPTPEPELPASGVWGYYLPIVGMGLVIFFFGKFLKSQMMSWEGKKKW